MASTRNILRRIQDKTGSSLLVILLAVLALEGLSLAGYQYTRKLLRKELDARAEVQLRRSSGFIEHALDKAELTMKEHRWDVESHLGEADSLMGAARRLLENNRDIVGACISLAPDYYPSKGRLYQPYAVRDGGEIKVYDLAATGHDYSQNPSFLRPLQGGKDEWSDPYRYGADSKVDDLITYAYPVRDRTGRVAAVCGLDIDLSWLGDTLNLHPFYPSSVGLALTREGRFIAGPAPDHPMWKDLGRIVGVINDSTLVRERKGPYDHIAIPGRFEGRKAGVHVLSLSEAPNWQIATVNFEDEVYAPARKMRLCNLLLALGSLLVLGFIAARYLRNARRLARAEVREARLGTELQVARTIQEEMLPKTFPPFPERKDLDIYGSLVPAREVGGDLFDFFIRDEKLFFCIGDVSGKGVPSAMVMSVVRALFRTFAEKMGDPARIVASLNAETSRGNESTMFVTFFLGVLDLPTGKLRYCNAGHDRPALMREGSVTLLDAESNLPIGVFPDTRYVAQECRIEPGTLIFLYTDGLTEAKDVRRQPFSRERMLRTLRNRGGKADAREVVETAAEAVRTFIGKADQSDDLTMLAIRYTPSAEEIVFSDSLTLSSDVAQVRLLGGFIKDVAARLALDAKAAHDLRLALEEIVVNVMSYAYPDGPGDVQVDVRADASAVTIVVTDGGVPFDPTEAELADTTLSVEERPVGGLGIFLARGLVDAVNYERTDGKNILTLKKKIQK